MQSKEIDTSTADARAAAAQEGEERVAFSENDTNLAEEGKAAAFQGSGSVAHQIIGQFIDALGKEDAYAPIAKRLKAVVFAGKMTEADLRTALFGEIEL